jgi:hypothetical protein
MHEPDHLVKAARAMLKPIVTAHGFQQYGARSYFRLCGWIAQALDLRKSAWGGGSFTATQYIFLLVPPCDGIGGVFGGRLPPKGQPWGRDGWWESSSPELALRSIDEVCDIFETVAMPRFQQGSTLAGLVEALRPDADGCPNTHFKKEVGCALVCDGHLHEGIPYLQKAERDYRAGFLKRPTAAWMETDANYMKALLDAIAAGQHHALLEEWFHSSVQALKIEKKWKTKHEANKTLQATAAAPPVL